MQSWWEKVSGTYCTSWKHSAPHLRRKYLRYVAQTVSTLRDGMDILGQVRYTCNRKRNKVPTCNECDKPCKWGCQSDNLSCFEPERYQRGTDKGDSTSNGMTDQRQSTCNERFGIWLCHQSMVTVHDCLVKMPLDRIRRGELKSNTP